MIAPDKMKYRRSTVRDFRNIFLCNTMTEGKIPEMINNIVRRNYIVPIRLQVLRPFSQGELKGRLRIF